jgi:hypothetical protein
MLCVICSKLSDTYRSFYPYFHPYRDQVASYKKHKLKENTFYHLFLILRVPVRISHYLIGILMRQTFHYVLCVCTIFIKSGKVVLLFRVKIFTGSNGFTTWGSLFFKHALFKGL